MMLFAAMPPRALAMRCRDAAMPPRRFADCLPCHAASCRAALRDISPCYAFTLSMMPHAAFAFAPFRQMLIFRCFDDAAMPCRRYAIRRQIFSR